jgi:hypothetical protein
MHILGHIPLSINLQTVNHFKNTFQKLAVLHHQVNPYSFVIWVHLKESVLKTLSLKCFILLGEGKYPRIFISLTRKVFESVKYMGTL